MKTPLFIVTETLHSMWTKNQLIAAFDNADFAVVFDDNTREGYFYLIDTESILDELFIYAVDTNDVLEIKILSDEYFAVFALMIDSVIVAVFDTHKQSWKNLSCFPCASDWNLDKNRELTDQIIEQYEL